VIPSDVRFTAVKTESFFWCLRTIRLGFLRGEEAVDGKADKFIFHPGYALR
jgi:hypothetical protein